MLTRLSLLGGELVRAPPVVRVLLLGVVEGPLEEVVGQVEGAVVVAAELEVNEGDAVVGRGGGRDRAVAVVPQQDVAALQVVVAEHHRRVDARQELSGRGQRQGEAKENA